MLVKLRGRAILENTYGEEELTELSVLESIYAIRKLKAVIDADGNFIEVKEGTDGQVYSEKYEIWFQENEYTK
jgi:hypothetical protein